MNYVGQLAGQVFVQVKELYRGLNPATLSGCIDVIVVKQPDGSLQCSPFHVRFGKMGVLRSREKVVDMEINGEPVDLHMKLGDNGEAFFVQETENDQEVVPSYLATSPILSDGVILKTSSLIGRKNSVGQTIQTLGSTGSTGEAGGAKKRRKRRRKARADSLWREESGEYSEDDDMFTIDISSDEGTEMESSRGTSRDILRDEAASGSFQQSRLHTRSDGEWSPLQRCVIGLYGDCFVAHYRCSVSYCRLCTFPKSPGNSRSTSPKSDSELMSKSSEAESQNPTMHWAWGELPQAATVSKEYTADTSARQKQTCFLQSQRFSFLLFQPSFLKVRSEPPPVCPESIPVSESTHFHSARMETETVQAGVAEARRTGDMEETVTLPPDYTQYSLCCSILIVKSFSVADKRSRHLGSDGIYLDDITELKPEVAALYFPKRFVASLSDPGLHGTSLSPQTVSSGGDSGVDSYCDHMADLPSITISLCGGLADNREITKEQFHEKIVSYQQFAENPSIIDDPNLVVRIGSKYYNWSTAAPLMLAMQAFQKPLPKATVEKIMKEKMPKKGGRWWFSWRGRNTCGSAEQAGKMTNRHKEESSSSDEDLRAAKQSSSAIQTDLVLGSGGVSYKKTLRLTSEQLMSLQLQDGPNDVIFSVTTQYQGTCRCQGTIYLWNWDDKIIISDIDGTITRSDTLGHILPTLGKDWTHQGIAQLYHKVSQNGYKFLYCSARAIGMADMTRGYLHWVNERGTMLPMGPVLLSPSSLFSALHREVIERKPEIFKVECLNDIRTLFSPNQQPFYAAFGNRPTDVYSYKEAGVPLNRIFTVNPKGELVQEHAKTNVSSYVRLSEVVDHVFPLKTRTSSSDFPCSDTFSHFTYWRQQLPLFHSVSNSTCIY
uniref:phosphatidate phosphatase n=1 Tax=Takifugu rubripes TaxID=31033 RepID=H2USI3_TAKRU